MTRCHRAETTATLIESPLRLAENECQSRTEIQAHIRFRCFYRRHNERFKHYVQFKQEAKRLAVVNAETITAHCGALNAQVDEYGFDAYRV